MADPDRNFQYPSSFLLIKIFLYNEIADQGVFPFVSFVENKVKNYLASFSSSCLQI